MQKHAKQTTKRCHWVPQAYLRGFAADPERREKIWRFSKTEGDPELKPIKKVAVRFHLYNPADELGRRDDSLEKKLASLEQWFSDPLWQELQEGMVDLSWKPLRKMVALMVAVMCLRNPVQFERTKITHRRIVDFIKSFKTPPNSFEHGGRIYKLDVRSWPAYRDATEEDLRRLWTSQVSSATWLAKILLDMRWAVLFSETPVFVTSDNPVTFLHPSLDFRGIKNPETTIIFPLSPTRVLSLDNRHEQPDARYYPLNDSPASTNLLVWRNAIDHLFSHRNPDTVCAELIKEAEHQGYTF